MATSMFNAVRTTVANQTPGYLNRAYIAATSQFTTIQEPTPGTGATSQTVAIDHVFSGTAGTNGFYEMYLLPKKLESSSESIGETGALSQLWKQSGFIPGDTAALQAMILELQNQDSIVLIQDATCPDGGVRQLGCDCTPVNVTAAKFGSGTVGGSTTKGWTIEFESACRYFYTGTIALHP